MQFGSDFVDDNLTNVVEVDTLTAKVSTVFTDSLVTSGTGLLLTGRYDDPYLGTVGSRSFLKLTPPSTQELPSSATYDSLTLIMKVKNSYYGDTTVTQHINVYRMAANLALPLYQSQFYNTSDFPIQSTPLGTASFMYRPSTSDTLAVKLADSLGQALFTRYKNKDVVLTDQSQFDDYFKGLCIAPDAVGNGALMSFSDSVIMRMYYHQNELYPTEKHVDFTINSTNLQFNHIDYTRPAGSSLADLSASNDEIVSDSTGHTGYWQPLTALLTKITFPYLKNVYLLPNYLQIIQATLIIRPVKASFNEGVTPLPPAFNLAETNSANDIGSRLATYVSGQLQTQNGDLVKDYLYGNTYYSFDITSFLQNNIGASDGEEIKPGLMLVPTGAYGTTLNRLVIGDRNNPLSNSNIEVKLYYIAYKP